MIPVEDPRAPKYWRTETSGVLEGPITRYLKNEGLSCDDIMYIRAYLRQWIDSPVWEMNPGMTDGDRATLVELRTRVRQIKSRQDISLWLSATEQCGMDPL